MQSPLFAAALRHHGAGQLQQAHELCRQILALNPNNVDALHLDGLIACQLGHAAAGAELLRKAAALNGKDPALQSNLGEACRALGRVEEAIDHFRRALALAPNFADAQTRLGSALLQQGKPGDATIAYRRSLDLNPAQPAARHNLRAALHQLGGAAFAAARHADALAVYEQALALDPDDVDSLNHCGRVLLELGRPEDALGRYERALILAPDRIDVLNNRGSALRLLGRREAAAVSYEQALAWAPEHPELLNNMGNTLLELGRHEAAVPVFERLLRAAPAYDYAPGNLLYAKLFCCDWTGYTETVSTIRARALAGERVALPFIFLSACDSAEAQLACTKTYAADKFTAAAPVWRGERYDHDRIRVAYLSADFRHHAVANSLVNVLERHDRSRFETIGVSLGAHADAMTGRLEKAFGRFIAAHDKSDREIALLLRECEVDIAVDLMGYTLDGRTGIFAQRPAPVQVSYLGYLGSMGADYIDYIVADPVVIPDDRRSHYTEKIVHLPDAFLPQDPSRLVAAETPTRGAAGLPKSGFVFCCFNSNYKIAPPVFDAWMRLLGAVEGSMLWLLEDAPAAVANRRAMAEERGIAPDRLVFAPRVGLDRHLARHRLADLFLDTAPYNAGATACDALWMGLPIVTCLGESFVGRMAGSLLSAAGLPELVTRSLAEYEALALKVAREPALLDPLRTRLRRSRETAALFDMDRYRRHLESAYETMQTRSGHGEPPASFAVAPLS